jgi:hypothetical protein
MLGHVSKIMFLKWLSCSNKYGFLGNWFVEAHTCSNAKTKETELVEIGISVAA